jgi:CTP:molybdopterin cytidylyltransferase MocA
VVVDLIGVLLAAGAGTRPGVPGGLMRAPDGTPWVVSSVRVLRDAGCSRIGVVVGAPDVVGLLSDEDVTIVPAPNWSDSMSISVRTGLAWATESTAPLAVFHRVDLPQVGTPVLRRVLAAAVEAPPYAANTAAAASPSAEEPRATDSAYAEAPGPQRERLVARASYQGAAGYPVVIGRAHWPGAHAAATDGRLMGPYLKRVPCPLIPCDDLVLTP